MAVAKSKIYYLVSRKEIPHLKSGRNLRIRESDLQKWLEHQVEEDLVPPIEFAWETDQSLTTGSGLLDKRVYRADVPTR